MIAIIDYGVGNLFSITQSLKKIGAESVVTADKNVIERADRLILPGVGAFGDAAQKLKVSGLDFVLKSEVKKGKPLLGICLGMQLLFDKSYEYGVHEGLGLIEGEVVPLADYVNGLKIPHMGWNSLEFVDNNPILKNLRQGEFVYFVHSYFAKCREELSATADYGIKVTAAVRKNNVYGVQFHPEKSGEAGLEILRAFSKV
ncbi:MAG: imidazole glycerol phosphate synthase subunit HisH [Clostridiales bacterium]|nr:imidazole glycerol phosphate synthase subunit HisH [Clostridiales bacterium]